MGPIEHYARATAKWQSRADRPVHTTETAAFKDLQRAEAADRTIQGDAQWLDTTIASLSWSAVNADGRRFRCSMLHCNLQKSNYSSCYLDSHEEAEET